VGMHDSDRGRDGARGACLFSAYAVVETPSTILCPRGEGVKRRVFG
jgi:hypothetical protein